MRPDSTLKLESTSFAQTINFGKLFSKALAGKDVVILSGKLGGGKTTFTRGILSGLGYRGRVLSPSFTLLRQYPAKKMRIFHADLYRLNKAAADNLGFEEFLYAKNSLAIIEWGDKIIQELPSYLKVKFSYSGSERRKLVITVAGYGEEKFTAIRRIFRNEPFSH